MLERLLGLRGLRVFRNDMGRSPSSTIYKQVLALGARGCARRRLLPITPVLGGLRGVRVVEGSQPPNALQIICALNPALNPKP